MFHVEFLAYIYIHLLEIIDFSLKFSVFTTKKITVNGPYFGTISVRLKLKMENAMVFVTVRFAIFYHKTENGLVLATVRFAVKKINGKRFCFCYGTVLVFATIRLKK